MSAISVFILNNVSGMPRTCCECVRVIARQGRILNAREPVVTARWSVEIDVQGKRRLVEHWFRRQGSRK